MISIEIKFVLQPSSFSIYTFSPEIWPVRTVRELICGAAEELETPHLCSFGSILSLSKLFNLFLSKFEEQLSFPIPSRKRTVLWHYCLALPLSGNPCCLLRPSYISKDDSSVCDIWNRHCSSCLCPDAVFHFLSAAFCSSLGRCHFPWGSDPMSCWHYLADLLEFENRKSTSSVPLSSVESTINS